MNANELDERLVETAKFIDSVSSNWQAVKTIEITRTMLRQKQAELDSLKSVVYWLKENRPEVWDDIKKWSKM